MCIWLIRCSEIRKDNIDISSMVWFPTLTLFNVSAKRGSPRYLYTSLSLMCFPHRDIKVDAWDVLEKQTQESNQLEEIVVNRQRLK